jgi:hypothetical protein
MSWWQLVIDGVVGVDLLLVAAVLACELWRKVLGLFPRRRVWDEADREWLYERGVRLP